MAGLNKGPVSTLKQENPSEKEYRIHSFNSRCIGYDGHVGTQTRLYDGDHAYKHTVHCHNIHVFGY